MWIRNTSRYSDREIRDLIQFATADIDMSNVCVNVRNGELAGGAYNGVPEISNAPPDAEYLITLRLGNGKEQWPLGPVNYHFKTPDEVGPRNRFPFYTCDDWREWLVKLAAHEAHHIKQFREDLVCSEIECEEFAISRLTAFRGGAPETRSRPPEPDSYISRKARRAGWGQEPDRPEPAPDPQLALF